MFIGGTIGRYRERPWWDVLAAVLFFALGTGMYLTGFYPILSTTSDAPIWLREVVLAVACAGVVFRRRAPLAGLGIGAAAAVADLVVDSSGPVTIVLIDLLYNATLHTTRRLSRAIVGTVVVLVVAAGIVVSVFAADWREAVLVTLHSFTVLVVPVWWAVNVRQQKEIADAERANAQQLRRIAELDRRAAVTAERARMARDLHDVVAGHLSAIAIQSEALLSMVDGDPRTVRRVLLSVRENSVLSLEEMRAMIGVLRADDEEEPLTAPARLTELDRLVESARAGGLGVDVRAEYDVDSLPIAVDLAAYRIVQEALTNAVKHAAGATARVGIGARDGNLVIEVTNDLTGTPGTGTGTGLVSMRERAQAVGGSFTAGPCAGGWRVRAVLPTGGTAT